MRTIGEKDLQNEESTNRAAALRYMGIVTNDRLARLLRLGT
jgi:hypothetical protein